MTENRRHTRKKIDIKSEVHFEGGMTFSNSIDLSDGGIFISTPEPLKEGTEVKLALYFSGSDPLEIKGKVKWFSEDESNSIGMGIEFVEISESDIGKINERVK